MLMCFSLIQSISIITPFNNKGALHQSSEDQIEISRNPVCDVQGQIQLTINEEL